MRKPISPTMHGILDYSTMGATAVAPTLLRFPPPAARAAYWLAAGYTALSALTDYRPALKRAVPLKVHAATDAALGVVLPMMPWLLGFAGRRRARNYFLALTAVTVGVTALTDWNPRRRR